jgi:hypothetical protein
MRERRERRGRLVFYDGIGYSGLVHHLRYSFDWVMRDGIGEVPASREDAEVASTKASFDPADEAFPLLP